MATSTTGISFRSAGAAIVIAAVGLGACTEADFGPPARPFGNGVAGRGGSGGASGLVGDPPPFTTGIAGTGVACGADGKPLGGFAPDGGIQLSLPTSVTSATTPVPPISGGTLLALADGKTVVASDPDRDRIYVVDLGTNAVRATIMLQAGDEPGRVIEDGSKRVHVALRRGGAIVTIDPATGTQVARRDVCSAPRGVAYQAAGDVLHVACAGGELVSLPAAGGAATRRLTLERDLRDVVVGAEGKLLVSTFRRADVLVVSPEGNVGERLHPGSGSVFSFVGEAQHLSPGVAWRMVPLHDAAGSVVVLHQTAVDSEINPAPGGYGGLGNCSAIVKAGVSVLTPGGATPPLANGFDMASLVVDVAVTPDGTQMAVAVPGNGATFFPTVMVGGIHSGQVDGDADGGVGDGGMAGAGGGCSFLAAPSTTPPRGEVVSVSYTSGGLLLAQLRDPALLWRADTGQQIVLSTEVRTDSGHQIFHANAGRGLACASCHPEGGEDGRTWKFACQGARRTQSIRGKISDTAPFHWDGTETDISKLMDDVFVGRMSGPQLSAGHKDALAGWIDTIPALPATAGLEAAAVERGKAIFNDPKVACGTCHAGPMLTNNATVDVGTGHVLQVPSLRGLPWRAPYMHDGCAGTLADRFGAATCSGGDKHGATSQLMPGQLADLTTYLQSL